MNYHIMNQDKATRAINHGTWVHISNLCSGDMMPKDGVVYAPFRHALLLQVTIHSEVGSANGQSHVRSSADVCFVLVF
jgi:hypothetical protein